MRNNPASVRHRSRTSRLCVEPLEDRQLLSAVSSPLLYPLSVSPIPQAVAAPAVLASTARPVVEHQSAIDTTPGDDGQATDNASASQLTGTQPARSAAGDTQTVYPTAASSYQQTYPASQGRTSAGSADPAGLMANANHVSADNGGNYYEGTPAYIASPNPQAADLEVALLLQPSGRTPAEAAHFAAAGHAAEPAAPAVADKAPANLTTVDRSLEELHSARIRLVSPPPPEVALENVPTMVTQEQPASPTLPSAGTPSALVPQIESLLAGALPIDLAGLEQAANGFLGRLERLAQDMTGSPVGLELTQWLVVTAAAVGAAEVIRGWTRPPRPRSSARGASEDQSWAPFPVLAVLPPEDWQ
jgi:hypothetical protein